MRRVLCCMSMKNRGAGTLSGVPSTSTAAAALLENETTDHSLSVKELSKTNNNYQHKPPGSGEFQKIEYTDIDLKHLEDLASNNIDNVMFGIKTISQGLLQVYNSLKMQDTSKKDIMNYKPSESLSLLQADLPVKQHPSLNQCETVPTLLKMGDQWLNNTDMNGFLTVGCPEMVRPTLNEATLQQT
ncbi:hypothetical protein HUJ05_005749 [Dendroctonus ponderosae]|nr:hypothetical protein HUJ05_005749 [Dendroctonus ponderosae]